MANENRPGSVRRIFEGTSGFIASATIIVAAAIHIANLMPQTWAYWFPEHKLSLLGFFNQERLSLANEGNYEYYISYLTYNHDASEVKKAVDLYGEDIADYLSKLCELPDEVRKSQMNLFDEESCQTKVRKMQRRLDKVKAIDTNAPSHRTWVPGKKARPVAETLVQETAREFEIPHSSWYGCPEIPIIENESKGHEQLCNVAEQKQRALALFAVSYQAFPINCVEANYYYKGDRAYQSIIEQEGYLEGASIKAHAAFHYYSKNPCDDNAFMDYVKDPHTDEDDKKRALAQCSGNEEVQSSADFYYRSDKFCNDPAFEDYLKDKSISEHDKSEARRHCEAAKEKQYPSRIFPDTILRRDLPNIVSLIRYKPTPFCAAIVREVVGTETFVQNRVCTDAKAEAVAVKVPPIDDKSKFPDCS